MEQEYDMKHIRAITLVAASAALLGLGTGAASAQTVSNGDEYQQGYAAGAAAQDKNSFDTYDQAYQAGKQEELNKQQAFNNGYQQGLAQADKSAEAQADRQDNELAYNQGAQDQAAQDADSADRAFDQGYNAAENDDAKFP